MGLLSGLIGNASQIDNQKIQEKITDIMMPNESIDLGFQLIRDLIVFTDKRLIIVDVQGVTGGKMEYKTIPYKSISRFSVETAGRFDLDAELKIWISSAVDPSESLEFHKGENIIAVQQALALAVCN